MLVCRDLEKAKEYGFKNIPRESLMRYKYLCGDIAPFISTKNGNFYLYTKGSAVGIGDNNLDFLYDMIKDGVIEKVEA